MPLNTELVPAGMTVVKEVTNHCFINSAGQVMFLRKVNGETTPMALKNIYDAISQCFHILDRTLGEMVDFYADQPAVYREGEIGVIRGIILNLHEAINLMTSSGAVASENALQVQRGFGQIVRRLGRVRNQHKKLLISHLQKVSQIRNAQGMRVIGAVLEPAQAHLAAVKRFDELDGIAQGVMVQAQRLIEIAAQAESRISSVYLTLSFYEQQVKDEMAQIEARERTDGVQPIAEHITHLRAIAQDVCGEGSNKVVNALRGVVMVEPFKSRLESPDVRCLEKLDSYLDAWQNGQTESLHTFLRAFGRARTKLKRVVREQQSPSHQRALEREYTPLR